MEDTQERQQYRKGIRKGDLILGILGIIVTLLLIVAIIYYKDQVDKLGAYGYIGAFIISIFGGATVLIPVPSLPTIFALGGILNPLLVGVCGGLGEPIGELTGYMAGRGGRIAFAGKYQSIYLRVESWMRRRGTLTIFLFAAVLNPFFDLVGFAAGAMHYPLSRFLFVCALGKIVKCSYVALAGAWGFRLFLRIVLGIFAG